MTAPGRSGVPSWACVRVHLPGIPYGRCRSPSLEICTLRIQPDIVNKESASDTDWKADALTRKPERLGGRRVGQELSLARRGGHGKRAREAEGEALPSVAKSSAVGI